MRSSTTAMSSKKKKVANRQHTRPWRLDLSWNKTDPQRSKTKHTQRCAFVERDRERRLWRRCEVRQLCSGSGMMHPAAAAHSCYTENTGNAIGVSKALRVQSHGFKLNSDWTPSGSGFTSDRLTTFSSVMPTVCVNSVNVKISSFKIRFRSRSH